MKVFNIIGDKIKTRKVENFAKSKYSNELKKFKDIHKGEKCFIIGNGPSLKAEDLTAIKEKGFVTFGFNRIFYIFDKTPWRPDYYICQDTDTMLVSEDKIDALDLKYKFFPISFKYFDGVKLKNSAYYFNFGHYDGGLPDSIFAEDFSEFVPYSNTVTCTAIQFAAYMGMKEIYLIGVDHSFGTYKKDGKIETDNTVKSNYFCKEYEQITRNGEELIPSVDISTQSYELVKKGCDAHGVKVYNATRGGKLEVFPRVDIDEVLK